MIKKIICLLTTTFISLGVFSNTSETCLLDSYSKPTVCVGSRVGYIWNSSFGTVESIDSTTSKANVKWESFVLAGRVVHSNLLIDEMTQAEGINVCMANSKNLLFCSMDRDEALSTFKLNLNGTRYENSNLNKKPGLIIRIHKDATADIAIHPMIYVPNIPLDYLKRR